YDRLPELAADLVRRQVAVITATGGTISAIAARSATTTIPIVFTSGDPVRMGLVASLNRPGGNITGVNLLTSALAAKRLELLHELVPAAKIIAMLVNPTNPNSEPDMKAVEAAAPATGVQIVVLKASNGAEIGKAFDALTQYKIDAILVAADPLFNNSG